MLCLSRGRAGADGVELTDGVITEFTSTAERRDGREARSQREAETHFRHADFLCFWTQV